MKLREISEPYISNLEAYRAEDERIDKQIERLKRKKNKLVHPFWIDQLVKPIAEFLLPLLPGYDRYEILGPFGICCETAIHFIAEGTDHKADREEFFNRLKSITFTPGDLAKGELSYRNYSVDTGEFAKGTLGAINGMNHPDTLIDPDFDLTELLVIINRKEKALV